MDRKSFYNNIKFLLVTYGYHIFLDEVYDTENEKYDTSSIMSKKESDFLWKNYNIRVVPINMDKYKKELSSSRLFVVIDKKRSIKYYVHIVPVKTAYASTNDNLEPRKDYPEFSTYIFVSSEYLSEQKPYNIHFPLDNEGHPKDVFYAEDCNFDGRRIFIIKTIQSDAKQKKTKPVYSHDIDMKYNETDHSLGFMVGNFILQKYIGLTYRD